MIRAKDDLKNQTSNMIKFKDKIEICSKDLEKDTATNETLEADNARLVEENTKLADDISNMKQEIARLNQKIELNELLKDVDLEELKLLSHNNNNVNSAILNLIGKWEEINSSPMK